jgi:DNA-directed RNA polymerase specialized sigma24 family protein
VAQLLGLSEETMKTRLHRARAQLRSALIESGHASPHARA